MAERYKRVFELESALYADAAPLIISAGVLLEDKLAHTTMAQLKLQSISPEEIVAVTVQITPLLPSGEQLSPIEYLYKSLAVQRDQFFGQKTAIIIPDHRASSFQVKVTEVVFQNKQVWNGASSEWTPVLSPKSMTEAYGDPQLSTQFSIRYGNDCSFLPQDDRDLWFCACGLINREDEKKCHGCRRVYSALKNVNLSALRSESQQRQETEQKQTDEGKKEQKKLRIKLLIAAAVLIPLLIAATVYFTTVPKMQAQVDAYNHAVSLLQNGQYDQAKKAFADLGDYEDSREQAIYNVDYEKAKYVMQGAQNDSMDVFLALGMKRSQLAPDETVSVALYKAAMEMFAALPGYKDCDAQHDIAKAAIDQHYAALKQAEYDAAVALLEERRYLEARDAFAAMGDYQDCPELMQECLYLRACALTDLAEQYSLQGVYSALSSESTQASVIYISPAAFSQLGTVISTAFREILQNVDIKLEEVPDSGFLPICSDISALFAALGDYKDSQEKIARLAELGDYTKPFYALCREGRLPEAYQWLDSYQEEFPGREQWLSALSTYIPYCGVWDLNLGDPTLIPMTVGVEFPCNSFRSVVIIQDYVITLRLYINGSSEIYIDLPLAEDGKSFVFNHDGMNNYIAALGHNGKFNYSCYNAFSQVPRLQSSCEYVRVA